MSTLDLPGGTVRGTVHQGIHSFKGIPYAEPITGRARWLPPVPRRPWEGVLDATRYGAACTQFKPLLLRVPFPPARARYLEAVAGLGALNEGDDCLVLNVWSKSLDRNARLPVMVWIHGGGFTGGGANETYDCAPFAAHDVVTVAIQYRLGPPGFLHGAGLFDGDFCGDNRAFQDQMLALKWVQENIERFGGDPGCVTLFGESAGAFAIFQLAASPQAKGLFRRAICMGGNADTCAPAAEYHSLTREALAQIGVKPGDEDALASLDGAGLQRLQQSASKAVFGGGDAARHGSLSRRKFSYMGAATGTAFLPAAPMSTYSSGTPNHVDLLLGTCANDGSLFSLVLPFRTLSAKMFSGRLAGYVPGNDMAALRAHYRARLPGLAPLDIHERANHDAFYRVPTLRAAEAHAAGHPGRTFHYQLDYPSAVAGLGAIHMIDVALLFRSTPIKRLLGSDAQTDALSALLLDTWISFAKTGKPQAQGLPEWLPFGHANRATMVFDRATRLVRNLDAELLAYWNGAGSPRPLQALRATA